MHHCRQRYLAVKNLSHSCNYVLLAHLRVPANQNLIKHNAQIRIEELNNIKLLEARENAGVQVAAALSFASDWLKGRHEFSGPIGGRSKAYSMRFLAFD